MKKHSGIKCTKQSRQNFSSITKTKRKTILLPMYSTGSSSVRKKYAWETHCK